MGRSSWSARPLVEESKHLSIHSLKKEKLLGSGAKDTTLYWNNSAGETTASIGITIVISAFELPSDFAQESYIELHYTQSRPFDQKQEWCYRVRLITTPCRFGGKRYWFSCPGTDCGKRVGKLYLPPGASYFLCRHCHDLTYEACRKHRSCWYTSTEQVTMQMKKIRERLDGSQNALGLFPPKPRRMRTQTYIHLRERYFRLEDQWQTDMELRCSQLEEMLGKIRKTKQAVGCIH